MGVMRDLGVRCVGLLLVIGIAVEAQQVPQTPCPSVFNYQTDGGQWSGLIQLNSPTFGNSLRLNLKMSIGVQLPTMYVGRLELLGGQTELLQQILRGGTLRYKVHFPLFSPLPRVTSITFNGILMCQGPPERAGYVTSINLDHTLSTGNRGVSGQNGPGGFNSGFERPGGSFHRPQQGGTFGQGVNYVHQGNYDQAGGTYQRPGAGDTFEFEIQRPTTVKPSNDDYNGFEGLEEIFRDPEATELNRPSNPYSGNNPIVIDFASGTGSYNNETVELRPIGNGPNYMVVYKTPPNPDDFARPVKVSNKVEETSTPADQPARACGVTSQVAVPLIVSGEATARGEWPWLAAIFVKKVSSLEFVCAGSIISNKHVVTAAHCVHSKGNRPVKVNELLVKAGVFNLQDWTDENTLTLAVGKVFLHPDFKEKEVLNTDIAILVLSKTITFGQYISAVCLWEEDADLSKVVGRKGAVIGWGRDENGLRATPEPRRADVSIVSTETCRASRPEFQVLTNEKTLCAGDKDGSGPCNGDSGGGMFLSQGGRWMLRGLVSNSLNDPDSTNTCNLHEYIIFTDTAKYLSWIKSVLVSN